MTKTFDRRARNTALTLAPHTVWAILFVVVPLLFVVYYAFTVDGSFSFDNLSYLLEPEILRSFGLSLLYAGASTIVCLVVAYPLALAISRASARWQSTLLVLTMLPMWVNFVIRTYAIRVIFNDEGIINSFLGAIGIQSVTFLGTPGLIIFGMVYNYLPYMVMPIYSVLASLDRRLIEAARDLGCNGRQVFTKVTFPLSLSGVISGITMVFVPAVSTFYISSTLSTGRLALVGDRIEKAFLEEYNYGKGAALSLVLMVMIFVCMWIMNRFGDKQEG